MGVARIPISTYRLQFNRGFTFRDAEAIVVYLDALGVGDCYASSYLKAVPGSPHGYDVTDPTRLNPDIGTDEDYWRWIDALKSRGMGHVIDLVEYLLYQTLLGAWPFETDAETQLAFTDRIVAFMTKAMREAKVNTSWLCPDEAHEAAVERFIRAVLDRRRRSMFLQAFEPFQARIAELGIYNSLAQLLVKITAPGVPDFYQGTELWDLSLVDPDNRRPVDYEKRRQMLAGLDGRSADDLLAHRADGAVKMFVAKHALSTRAAFRDLYELGEYVPLETAGTRAVCLFAFARVGAAAAITCVPRLVASLTPDAGPPLGHHIWSDTRVQLPPRVTGRTFRDAFTGTIIEAGDAGPDGGRAIAAEVLFGQFPVALLLPCSI